MSTVTKTQLNKTINSFFKDVKISGGDFIKNATLWQSTGDVVEFPAKLTKTTGENAKVDWKLNVDHTKHTPYIHTNGVMFEQVQDLYDAEVTEINVKIVLQKARPFEDTESTRDYVETLPNGKNILKAYNDALKDDERRVMLVSIPN